MASYRRQPKREQLESKYWQQGQTQPSLAHASSAALSPQCLYPTATHTSTHLREALPLAAQQADQAHAEGGTLSGRQALIGGEAAGLRQ